MQRKEKLGSYTADQRGTSFYFSFSTFSLSVVVEARNQLEMSFLGKEPRTHKNLRHGRDQ